MKAGGGDAQTQTQHVPLFLSARDEYAQKLETEVLTVPPPALNLDLRLDCSLKKVFLPLLTN